MNEGSFENQNQETAKEAIERALVTQREELQKRLAEIGISDLAALYPLVDSIIEKSKDLPLPEETH